MKTASPELIAFLASARAGVKADLYTITLRRDGSQPEDPIPVEQTNVSGNWLILDSGETYPNLDGLVFQTTIETSKPDGAGVIIELAGWNDGDPRQLLQSDGSGIPDGQLQAGDVLTFFYDSPYWRWIPPAETASVYRWTDADVPISLDGVTWGIGPKIERQKGASSKAGIAVDTMALRLLPTEGVEIGGTTLIPFLRRGGLDGATVLRERVFGPDPSAMVGKIVMFAGRVTNVSDITGTEATVEVASWTELLNVSMPRNLVQPPCLHTVYDAGCGLSRFAFEAPGVVEAGTASEISFPTDLAEADGYFNQGTIRFTSGALEGQVRTIRSSTAAGVVSVILPLTVAPTAGDAFVAYPGCDRSLGTCEAKFDNRLRFRGFKDVPLPETAV